MLDNALVHYNSYTDDAHDGVLILVVLDDALVLTIILMVKLIVEVSILVVLDDALVLQNNFIVEPFKASQSLLCWTML